jgi:hypothetical protein
MLILNRLVYAATDDHFRVHIRNDRRYIDITRIHSIEEGHFQIILLIDKSTNRSDSRSHNCFVFFRISALFLDGSIIFLL